MNVESCMRDFSLQFSVSLSWTCVNKSDVSAFRNGANHEHLMKRMRCDIKSNKQLSTFLWTKWQRVLKKILHQVLQTEGSFCRWSWSDASCFFSENCWKNMPYGRSCDWPSSSIPSNVEEWRVPFPLAKRVAELVFTLVVHKPKSFEFS